MLDVNSNLPKALLCLVVLSACGGGGGNSIDDPSFATFVSDAESILGSSGGISLNPSDVTPVASVPISGSADYQGFLAILIETDAIAGTAISEADIIGELSLSATFTSTGGTIDGVASNFLDSADNEYTGDILVETGDIRRGSTSVSFNGDISGELVGPGAGAGVYDGTYFGGFGTDEALPGALISGDVIEDGTETGFSGAFIASESP